MPNPGVTVVTANYNTKHFLGPLLWSLHHFLGEQIQRIIVVDNGSTDGSRELLTALDHAGICTLVANPTNRQHGPALSQGIAVALATETPPRCLWLLDSDCVIARPDTLDQLEATAAATGAALVGERYQNPWHQQERIFGFSVLLDPTRAWSPTLGPIPDGGDPLGDFEQTCRAAGIPTATFPFSHDGYVIHLGRGTLAQVRARGESDNPHFDWAQTHYEPHFQEVIDATERYATLLAEFAAAVPDDTHDTLIAACRRC